VHKCSRDSKNNLSENCAYGFPRYNNARQTIWTCRDILPCR